MYWPSNTPNTKLIPPIVPVFYQLAQSQEKNGIAARTIGNSDSYFIKTDLSKEGILTVKNKTEEFIPIQQNLGTKVKMNFENYPLQAGNFSVFNKKQWVENISFNYDRKESNLIHNNKKLLSEIPQITSISSVFDQIRTENNDSQIWKWFLIFALLMLISETAIIRFVK